MGERRIGQDTLNVFLQQDEQIADDYRRSSQHAERQ